MRAKVRDAHSTAEDAGRRQKPSKRKKASKLTYLMMVHFVWIMRPNFGPQLVVGRPFGAVCFKMGSQIDGILASCLLACF